MLKVLGIVLAVIAVFSFYFIKREEMIDYRLEKSETLDISVWVVDWDLSRGEEEIDLYDWSSIQYFGAYFNEADELIIDEELVERLSQASGSIYLTVVNDVIKVDGTSVQKDPELVRRLLGDEFHVQDLVELVLELEVDGLELDYEKIPLALWNDYARFIEALGRELAAVDKELRVILEPSSPIEQVELPADYEYVMMAYNLYGYHSGPGPKADIEFISQLGTKIKNHLSDVRIAFSLGGFDWADGEKPKALTMVEAQSLADERKASCDRDDESGALYFNYVDELGKSHEVWFADQVTIESWMDAAKRVQIDQFALWRLGGNG